MGAYSPAPVVTEPLFKEIMDKVIFPVVNTLAKDGKPYKGALYAGIIDNAQRTQSARIQCQVRRSGDAGHPARLKSDLVELMERAIDGKLGGYGPEWISGHAYPL